ncbi:MAG: UDP-N-acetylmuramate:L-alanyl-gamma-D-glutamyl-meso-diaminopimelate ligase, partial [Gammaproteobacteria bacterium]|nr:UDP-N-acetylmuramate:L-alanyl-gamma-D-glutamyl-meso-diaminopimelate ligase [Gammaproteobacteria bacterium]
MHIHILGICGTFMGSLALLARELGYRVTGVDQQVYPPMSSQLEASGIELFEGYDKHGLDALKPDAVIIGNALSRGNPAVEYVLESGLPYYSGPQWLAQHVLRGKTVLAVAGTHGKTTTASMLAWILECAGKKPGFLIGGVPENFSLSARLGVSEYFVIEADEYDSAFFDKRSKFVHYRPQVLLFNNLEFDHADIFDDLAAIQRQFHHVVRTVPASGCILMPDQKALHEVIEQGLWSQLEMLSGVASPWCVTEQSADQGQFKVQLNTEQTTVIDSGVVSWELCGVHNIANAVAAIAAAHKIDVSVATSTKALGNFSNVKRRLQLLDEINGIRVYDDFAHHPSAIKTTLEGLAS